MAEHEPEELLRATGEFLAALAVVRAEGEEQAGKPSAPSSVRHWDDWRV